MFAPRGFFFGVTDGAVELPPTLLLHTAAAPAASEQLWGGWGQGNGWVHVMDATQFHAAVLPNVGHQYQLDYHAPGAGYGTASTYHTDYGGASASDMGGHDIDIGDVDLGGGIDCMADLCF